jgi:hypothetical protein
MLQSDCPAFEGLTPRSLERVGALNGWGARLLGRGQHSHALDSAALDFAPVSVLMFP